MENAEEQRNLHGKPFWTICARKAQRFSQVDHPDRRRLLVALSPARFLSRDIGSTRLSKLLPAGQYRWSIPVFFGHNINTSVVKAT
jgi:hypothetical protein